MISIDDTSRIAEVRRAAIDVAHKEGLDDAASDAAIVATEAATNILKHAGGGEVQIRALSTWQEPGIEIVAIDRGPGMPNLQQCFIDGYSSAGTAGNGLGAMRRLSREFDGYSEPGKGTVVFARVGGRSIPQANGDLRQKLGVAGRPVAGELASGDAWACRKAVGGVWVIVADGLGHGVLAAEASAQAISAFQRANGETSPAAVLQRVHLALKGTRGAAVAIAHLDFAAAQVRFAGLGNIAGTVISAAKTQSMISHNGTAGHEARQFREFTYPLPEGSLVVMHSDGLSSHWNLAGHAGLQQRHPSVIAAVLYREAGRTRDDACVVVVKGRPSQ